MLIMDSGLGGISVVRALRAADATAPFTYLADTAGFPYGDRDPASLTKRATGLIHELNESAVTNTIVLACNTLSTLCLADLRAAFPRHQFVGTVPAVKVAAQSGSQRFTLLATPNTAHSSYTNRLIAEFASGAVVDAAPAPNLAAYAEKLLLGDALNPRALKDELATAFHDDARGKTDTVVLGCTHYPLVLDQLKKAAPWDVRWIDSGEAIARRALALTDQAPATSVAYVTHENDIARYKDVFTREGFDDVRSILLS